MSLQSLLNQNVTIWRNLATSGSKKQYSQVSQCGIMIAPMSAMAADVNKMALSRAYTGYVVQGTNVLIGDYILDSSGTKYDVQGDRNYTMGSQPLIELTLQRQTQQGQL